MMPPTNRPKARVSGQRPIVTSLLLIMLAVMIVRDILIRRWTAERRPPRRDRARALI